MILDEIIAERKKAVGILKESTNIEIIEKQIVISSFQHYSFKNALSNKSRPLNIIAEVKKASPSKGVICQSFSPVEIARDYEKGGAAAVSVLTEPKYFQGCNQYLMDIKKHVALPVLRKDFIVDEIQIYEAKTIGADAILLIVSALSSKDLHNFLKLAASLDLDVLVETHDEREVAIALEAGAEIIGVNNRNLKTFEVSLETTKHLRHMVPKECVFVAESGIHTVEDIVELKALKVDAVLIGESIVKAENRMGKLKELIEA